MFFEFDDFDVRERFYIIEEKTERLKLFLESLSSDKRNQFRDMCVKAYVYHDSALDGLVVSSDEISSVFSSDGTGPYVRSRVMQEIKNHRDILRQVQTDLERFKSADTVYQCDVIQPNDVVDMHKTLYSNVMRKDAGKLRKTTPLHTAYFHSFMDYKQVEHNLQELCRQTEDPDFRAQHPINQAAMFHRQFMNVFPFMEGSGKVGRLFMNGFLIQGGYDIVIIHASERQRYYETLRDGHEQLRELLLDSMEHALDTQLKYISDTEIPSKNNRNESRAVQQ